MCDSAIWQGSVRLTERGVLTGTDECLHAVSKVPEGRLTYGLDSSGRRTLTNFHWLSLAAEYTAAILLC